MGAFRGIVERSGTVMATAGETKDGTPGSEAGTRPGTRAGNVLA